MHKIKCKITFLKGTNFEKLYNFTELLNNKNRACTRKSKINSQEINFINIQKVVFKENIKDATVAEGMFYSHSCLYLNTSNTPLLGEEH